MYSQAAKASKPNAIYADHILNNLSTSVVFWQNFHSKKHHADAKVRNIHRRSSRERVHDFNKLNQFSFYHKQGFHIYSPVKILWLKSMFFSFLNS